MEYKGYIGNVTYDYDARIFHGEIINTKAVITFQGKTVDEIELAFKDSIDDYLNWCKEDGVEPETPYFDSFDLEISPELYKKIAVQAMEKHISVNQFVEQAVSNELCRYN